MIAHFRMPKGRLRFGWLLVLSLFKEDCFKILNVCPFDDMAVTVSGKVERS